MSKAYQILRSGGFQPEEVKKLEVAFEMAWAVIEERYNGPERSDAREKLARAIVTVAVSRRELGAVEIEKRALVLFDVHMQIPSAPVPKIKS